MYEVSGRLMANKFYAVRKYGNLSAFRLISKEACLKKKDVLNVHILIDSENFLIMFRICS